ncbi:hypothetical protein HLV39_05370 [Marinobacter adhaerens]|uniref:Uncharacterized protein n=1 Tax=Marinobacter adhaerens TaxID=1033846 RepID=A0A851HY95_9GAMM|nr:hypothetical protein [Marinobacter adhaerens]NWN90921.1 hypothetical protein [Marinobacter adhaerens]
MDVSWDVSAVQANFDRIFQPATGGASDTSVYWVPAGSDEQKVSLEVYPYRDGSQMEYEFKVNYELRGDGTSTYPANQVAGIIQKIE